MNQQADKVEHIKPYGRDDNKSGEVEQMFDSIAPAYDFMNTAMTFGLHRNWRNTALDEAAKALAESGRSKNPDILDVATGTGDVALELHRRFPGSHVTGIDLSTGMLDVGRGKLSRLPEEERRLISFESGDCLGMRFGDASFDLVTVAYGVRNFEHLLEGYKEIFRVLKPGGTLCVVELSEPDGAVMRSLYRLYARGIIPMVGKVVSGDSRAYTYLPESIAAAPQRKDMAMIMKKAGFRDCRWQSLTFGAVTYYLAQRPE